MDSVGEGEGEMIWENGIEICIVSYILYYYRFVISFKIKKCKSQFLSFLFFFFKFYFIFKLYIIVLVLPNIKMNPPQVYMCSPS